MIHHNSDIESIHPLVTIAIPTYNRRKTLGKAIESALYQDYPNLEILVCDNASTDGTEQLVNDYLARDCRLRYERAVTNEGPLANFERGKKLSRGQFFMWLADDDYLAGNYVSACLQKLLEDETRVVVGGMAVFFCEEEGTQFKGHFFDLSADSRWRRLWRYYGWPADNSIFYGLMRAGEAKRNKLRKSVTGDHLFCAGMAVQGTILTITETRLYRRRGGSSASYDRIAQVCKIPRWHFRFLGTISGMDAARDIFDNPAYGGAAAVEKWMLAAMVFIRCFVINGIRHELHLLRFKLLNGLLGPVFYDQCKARYYRFRGKRQPGVL